MQMKSIGWFITGHYFSIWMTGFAVAADLRSDSVGPDGKINADSPFDAFGSVWDIDYSGNDPGAGRKLLGAV